MMLAIPQPGGTRASEADRYYVTVIPVYGLFLSPCHHKDNNVLDPPILCLLSVPRKTSNYYNSLFM